MEYVRILIGESEGGESCLSYLPAECRSSHVKAEVIQCTSLSANGGCSIIRIRDPDRIIDSGNSPMKSTFRNGSECTLDRISSQQYVAMVKNHDCKVARIITEAGCFVTSAVKSDDGDICWTIVGMDNSSIGEMIQNLEKAGYKVQRKSTFAADLKLTLSNKEEETIRAAYSAGYYQIPKQTDIRAIADSLNCSKSTADTTLRSAETKIITFYLENNWDTRSSKK